PPPAAPLSTPPSSQTPPPPPPSAGPIPKKKTHRFRNFLLTLTTLIGLSFAGGVYYSLISDNFHDFFTEYIPFGEEAVLYVEEREFKKRFPNAFNIPRVDRPKVSIGRESGVHAAVSEPDEQRAAIGERGPHLVGTKQEDVKVIKSPGEAQAVTPTVIGETKVESTKHSDKVAEAKKEAPVSEAVPTKSTEELTRTHIHPISLEELESYFKDSSKVIRQQVVDLATNLNEIISHVNENGRPSDFAAAVEKAKAILSKLSKNAAPMEKVASTRVEQVEQLELQYTKQLAEIAERAQAQVQARERAILTEVNSELGGMWDRYEDKLAALRAQLLENYNESLRGELEAQELALKKQFAESVSQHVETERNSRLGKIKELEAEVDAIKAEFEKYSQVVDYALYTQRLQIALDELKEALDDNVQPRPFVRELANLKEAAGTNPAVNAAIGTINPKAYQKGLYTQGQLINRFRTVSEEVRKAALLPENAGVAGHAASWVLSKVMFKKSGLALGEDVESVLTRTETFLQEGDLERATREMESLKGWAGVLSQDWLKEARMLLEVRKAVEVSAEE
ncbi:hypothetical protein BJ508DRAFT_190258, partial [Ascobolus immersus RN42]